MDKTRIAVLITCFNRKEKTLKCLENLYQQDGITVDFYLDIYLTNDASTDGTPEAIHSNFPDVKIIQGNGSLFWNRGMKLAWETAATHRPQYDFYLWLNDDITLFRSAIKELLFCAENDKANLVCGAFKSEKESLFTYGAMTIDGAKIIPNGKIQSGCIINGNAVLVNKKAYLAVGSLDSIYPHAIGDHDYGLRLLKKGGTVLSTRQYIGICEKNAKLPKWCYSSTPLKDRIKALYSPLGYAHPIYFFIYERRHFGLLRAIKHFLSIHLRVLVPSLWKQNTLMSFK